MELSTLLEVLKSHPQVAGFLFMLAAAWYLVRFGGRIALFLRGVEDRAERAEGYIAKIATNDFPHMEKSLASIERSLRKLAGEPEPED